MMIVNQWILSEHVTNVYWKPKKLEGMNPMGPIESWYDSLEIIAM